MRWNGSEWNGIAFFCFQSNQCVYSCLRKSGTNESVSWSFTTCLCHIIGFSGTIHETLIHLRVYCLPSTGLTLCVGYQRFGTIPVDVEVGLSLKVRNLTIWVTREWNTQFLGETFIPGEPQHAAVLLWACSSGLSCCSLLPVCRSFQIVLDPCLGHCCLVIISSFIRKYPEIPKWIDANLYQISPNPSFGGWTWTRDWCVIVLGGPWSYDG